MVQATEAMKIDWQDLQGSVEPYYNPFEALSDEQLYYLSIYARVTEIEADYPEQVTDAMKEEATAAKAALVADNIDIAYLLAQRLLLIEKRQKAAKTINPLLADKKIEMSGFMLALTFDNGLVSEFLLVPVMGACSHKPVPAANQIVYVTTQKAVKTGSPYMPVTVTGMLRITPQEKDLYLVDGQKVIEMAYSLEDTLVEPHIATH